VRSQNLNTPERVQREKVRIPGNDVGPLAAYGKFEELVVFWITASLYLSVRVNPLRLACQRREKGSNIFLVDITAEPFSVQYFIQLGKRRKGNQDFSFF
jgi:hypothetical protein